MSAKPAHGAMGTGQWSHTRWCAGCNHYHGVVFVCEHYPLELQAELTRKGPEAEAAFKGAIIRAMLGGEIDKRKLS